MRTSAIMIFLNIESDTETSMSDFVLRSNEEQSESSGDEKIDQNLIAFFHRV